VRRLLEWTIEATTAKKCRCGWEGKETVRDATTTLPSLTIPSEATASDTTESMSTSIKQARDAMGRAQKVIDSLWSTFIPEKYGSSYDLLRAISDMMSGNPLGPAACGNRSNLLRFNGCGEKHDCDGIRVPITPSNGTIAHRPVDPGPSRIVVSSNDRSYVVINREKGVEKLIEKAWRKQRKEKEKVDTTVEQQVVNEGQEDESKKEEKEKKTRAEEATEFVPSLIKLGQSA